MRRFGVARLLAVPLARSMNPSMNSLPDDVVYRLVLFDVEEDTLQSHLGLQDMANNDQLSAAQLLGNLPVVVLTADSSPGNLEGWGASQQRLAEVSDNSAWIMVENSSHDIHLDQPQQVANAVLRVIEAAQTGQLLAQ
jgi:pimeloyl-ACP methyl ester carboxylesterase